LGDDRAIRAGGERLDAQVDAYHRAGVGRIGGDLPLLHLHPDVPMPRLLGDGSREGRDTRCPGDRQIAMLFQAQAAQSGQLDGIREDDNGAGQAKTTQPTLLGLGLRIAEYARQLAFSLERTTTEELREGGVQVAQRFLRRTLGDLVHPRRLGLLEDIELAVQVHGRGAGAGGFVGFLLAPQAPIVGTAGCASMSLASGHLLVIQIQLQLIAAHHGYGPGHSREHGTYPLPSLGVSSSRVCQWVCGRVSAVSASRYAVVRV
jgi:hypothetical protein